MDGLGTIMMITALAWPLIGGAIVGLIGGIVKGHGLVGTLIDAVLGAIAGYLLTVVFVALSGSVAIPDQLGLALSLGLPVIGGLLAFVIKGRFSAA